MTDKKPQQSPPPAPLTDTQRVGQQVGFTDMTTTAGEVLSGMFPFGGRSASSGRPISRATSSTT